ncbi:MAG: hypothetical protein J6B48_02385 [Clostridia bacterium]|nr:hypothetical protein [Clostridia bacterium]
MKSLRAVFIIAFFTSLFFAFCITGHADGESEALILRQYAGRYIITEGEEAIYDGESLSQALITAAGKKIIFDNVRIYEELEISQGNFIFSGKAFFEGEKGISVRKNTSLFLEEFTGEFSHGEVSVTGGELFINDSTLVTESECMINADESTASVTVVGGSRISGKKYDITGYMTLMLYDSSGNIFTSDKALKYKCMEEKTRFYDLFGVRSGEVANVKAYNALGEEKTVCRVSFINSRAQVYSEQRLKGEILSPPAPESIAGYEFLGWSRDRETISDNEAVLSDCIYSAMYRLKPPTGKVNGLKFTYDGKERKLEPTEVYHPLLPYGNIKYLWYLGDRVVSEERVLSVSDVNQSGNYRLVIEFEYSGEKSSIEIGDITVEISPIELTLDYDDGEFIIVGGSVAEGDEAEIKEKEIDGKIYAEIGDSNYCLNFSPVIQKNNKMWIGALIGLSFVLSLLLLASYLVFKSDEKDRIVKAVGERESTLREDDPFVKMAEETTIEKSFFALDKSRADELISDHLAKNMVFPGGRVETDGRESVNISLGNIDNAFSDGDKIDINALKKKGLCPEDAFRVRIASEGTISKSFTIFANDFDTAAVKMIALSGGRAVKVKSKKKKL